MHRPGTVPLERALSKLGVASRATARGWVLAGRVSVDGRPCRDPERPVVPETARIEIDGVPVRAAPWRTILLRKPRGVVVTRSDEKGRPTVYSLLPEDASGLHAVGRLDFATAGLLLLTNDTRLSSWLTDPANRVPRTYVVTVRGRLDTGGTERLVAGIEEGGERLRAERVGIRKTSGRESEAIVVLTEGRNREVRRMFSALGHEVTKLRRVAFGGLVLGDLAPGRWRDLTREEVLAAFPGAPLSR